VVSLDVREVAANRTASLMNLRLSRWGATLVAVIED